MGVDNRGDNYAIDGLHRSLPTLLHTWYIDQAAWHGRLDCPGGLGEWLPRHLLTLQLTSLVVLCNRLRHRYHYKFVNSLAPVIAETNHSLDINYGLGRHTGTLDPTMIKLYLRVGDITLPREMMY